MARFELRTFTVEVEPVTAGQGDLERRLEDFVDARGMQLSGNRHSYVVTAERSVRAAEQVELIDWLLGQPGVRAVRLRQLGMGKGPASPSEGSLRVNSCDVPVIALSMLYRSRCLAPELYLQILGGLARSLALH